MSATYRIPDEPLSGRSTGWVLDPFWPLLAIMLGGVWLAAPLFVINAWFLRGPTWRKEIVLAILLVLGGAAILFGLETLHANGLLPDRAIKYAILALVAWKLAVTYWLFFLQQSAFALFQYFGGVARQGIFVAAGLFARGPVLKAIGSSFWQAVLS